MGRDGEVMYLLIEDPRTAWDRKTELVNRKTDSEAVKTGKPGFWSREFRDAAVEKRMPDGEFQKQNAQKIGGVTVTEAKVPIALVIRNSGLKALDGVDILVPEPFCK